MDPTTILANLGKIALDLIKELRAFLNEKSRAKDALGSQGGFLKVYGSLVVLDGYANELRKLADRPPATLARAQRQLVPAFLKEVRGFAAALAQLDLSVAGRESNRRIRVRCSADRRALPSSRRHRSLRHPARTR